jgi:hypothetical protein
MTPLIEKLRSMDKLNLAIIIVVIGLLAAITAFIKVGSNRTDEILSNRNIILQSMYDKGGGLRK